MPAQSEKLLTARIVEWNRQKGYGFLQVAKQRVLLHVNDFAERHKKSEVGDSISFMMGADSQGRTCAKNAVNVNDGGRITGVNVLVLLGLLVLPVLSLKWQAADFRWVAAYTLIMSALTYGAYALDKQRARTKEWRLAEIWLHLLELLGGWPGAFLAQRRLLHKCSKPGYQFMFWLIVLVYQFAAFDSLQEWKFSRAAWEGLKGTSHHWR